MDLRERRWAAPAIRIERTRRGFHAGLAFAVESFSRKCASCVHARRTDCARVKPLVLKHLYHARGSDGNDYEVHVYVEPANHTNAHIERIARVSLADGRELRLLARRHYQIVDTGVTLEAHDEQAI